MPSQNIYEYNKLKPLDLGCAAIRGISKELTLEEQLIYMMNKINELVIEYNHLAKDFELYKKAYKIHTHPVQIPHTMGIPLYAQETSPWCRS